MLVDIHVVRHAGELEARSLVVILCGNMKFKLACVLIKTYLVRNKTDWRQRGATSHILAEACPKFSPVSLFQQSSESGTKLFGVQYIVKPKGDV
jgi:hypothetical protein